MMRVNEMEYTMKIMKLELVCVYREQTHVEQMQATSFHA